MTIYTYIKTIEYRNHCRSKEALLSLSFRLGVRHPHSVLRTQNSEFYLT